MQGQLSKAWETLQKSAVFGPGAGWEPLPLAGLVDIGLGEILLEHDLLEEARDYLERGCRVTQSMWYIGSLDGMISLARLRQAMGDIPGSQAVLAEAARMALSTDASEWDDAVVAAVAVRLALQRDDLAAAEQWWKKGGFPDLNAMIALEDYPYHIFEYLLLTQARFLLVKGQDNRQCGTIYSKPQNCWRRSCSKRSGFNGLPRRLRFWFCRRWRSLLWEMKGRQRPCCAPWRLGEPEGYRRVYLDEGWRLAELLRQCRSHSKNLAAISLPWPLSIVCWKPSSARGRHGSSMNNQSNSGQAQTTAHLEDGLPISLSAREMEVLALIAEGKSNQEISAELYLALNTVKRHAYNIYAKLEVKKRTQAVSKARQFGLIP